MLLAAGYFRARIQDLSPFDKVVGGMVWSITASGVDVGVDILFQENSTIGDRIKLCEQLVKALMHMKCPLPLQSHQIQGLDYENLKPVLQWLIKKVLETRRLTGDLIRALSVSQFDKEYEFPEEKLSDDAAGFVQSVGDRYRPQRKFKKVQNASFDSVAQRTEATLLEYGEKLFGAVVYDEEKQDRKREREEQRSRGKATGDADADAAEQEAVRKAQEEEQQRLDAMQQQMSEEGANVSVSGGNLGNIMTMQADQIRRAAEEYNEEMKALAKDNEDVEEVARQREQQAFERQAEALKKKIKAEEAKINKKTAAYEQLEQKVQELKAQVAKKQTYHARIISESEKLDEIEKDTTNKGILDKLKQLVFLNESLKAQEKQFKESCQQQRAQLLAMMKEIEAGDNDEETKRMMEIEKFHSADLAKLQKLRQVLAKKNQEIAKITRAIDDIPTRAELLQYERRFVELYELVQEKLVETRKYYEFYNTLNETFQFMTNEDSLLNSIIEGFPVALKSSQKVKDKYLASFSGIIENVEQNKANVEGDLQQEVIMRDMLNQKCTKLLEKQRKYFKAVKEFQEECYKNEKLSESLARMG
jgi:hypothetical protein